MTQVRRLKPKPWNHGQAHTTRDQCEFTLDEMSLTSTTQNRVNWRQQRYIEKGLDPNRCIHGQAVEIKGRKLCNLHAGQIALGILLGEET